MELNAGLFIKGPLAMELTDVLGEGPLWKCVFESSGRLSHPAPAWRPTCEDFLSREPEVVQVGDVVESVVVIN